MDLKVGKRDNSIVLKGKTKLSNEEYNKKLIYSISGLYVPIDFWLTERETDFLSLLIKVIMSGNRDIFSDEALELFKENGFKNKNTVKVWEKRVSDKEWIKREKKQVYLNDILELCIVNKSIVFDLTVENG